MLKPADEQPSSPVLITMGDPAGVGPEVAAKAWMSLGGRIRGRSLKFVGNPAVFRRHGSFEDDAFWPDGKDVCNTDGIIGAIDIAARAALSKAAAAIVTSPIEKARLQSAGFKFPGHTEYLAQLTGVFRAVMMLSGAGLRVVPLTVHIPLGAVSGSLSRIDVLETAEIVLRALSQDFGVVNPRLAIAGLNPHAGEAGNIGREEIEIIAPAAEMLRKRGHCVLGPLPADTMFHAEARSRYDAALCMYHDQALVPLKALAFWEGVNITLGIPIVRTSPDHGTARDIAGRGIADPRSMISAIRTAAAIADARNL